MSYYSRSYFQAEAGQTDFTVSFPYLDRTHVKVYVNGDLTTAWSWVNSSTIRLTTGAAEDDVVLLKRETSPQARLVDYVSPSSLNEDDLDTDSLQGFYLAQEANDQANSGVADDPVSGQYSAGGKRITNLGTPVDDTDAVTKVYTDGVLAGAIVARDQAEDFADEADGYADAAAASASAAAASAGTASTKATEATTGAATATTKAAEAAASATTATTKAAEASTSASTASTAATTATTKASEASTSAATATTKASEASTSASTASTAATTATTKAAEASASATAAEAAKVAAEAAAGSLTPVQDQINAATNVAFADSDMLVARRASNGLLAKWSWSGMKSALAAIFVSISNLATAAQFRSATAGKVLTADVALSAMNAVSLTYAATITIDHNDGVFRAVTLTGNPTFAAPTNLKDGWPLTLRITQDGTGSRVPAWNAAFDFRDQGTPTLSTGAGKTDFLYFVADATSGKLIFNGMSKSA